MDDQELETRFRVLLREIVSLSTAVTALNMIQVDHGPGGRETLVNAWGRATEQNKPLVDAIEAAATKADDDLLLEMLRDWKGPLH